MHTVRARIAAENEDMVGVMSVTVFGHELSQEFSEIEVSEDVLAKLKGNPTIDVQVRAPKAAAHSTTAKAGEAHPNAPNPPVDTAPAVSAPKG